MPKTKVGVVERVLDRFVSSEAKILADHLHRPLEDEHGYFDVAKYILLEGEFSLLDCAYLKLAAHQNMVQETKNTILRNVLEVTKVEVTPTRRRRKV